MKIDLSDFDDLVDDIIDEVDPHLRRSAEAASRYVVIASPVWTGRFRGNWSVSLGEPMMTPINVTDKEGSATIGKNISTIKSFTLKKEEKINIENTVQDPDTNEYYAASVSFDYTGDTSDRLLTRGQIVAAEALNT